MIIEKKSNEPSLHLSKEDCIFKIEGDSYSEEISVFYEKIINWIDSNLPEIECELQCIFRLHIINSISYRNLVEIFLKLSENYKNGIKMQVSWYYDKGDDDMLAIAEDFKAISNIPIKTISEFVSE